MRADILGALTPEPLIVADRHRAGPTLDAEVKTLLLLAAGNGSDGRQPRLSSATSQTAACSARCGPGSFRRAPTAAPGRVFVRIAPEAYVGLAQYRHLEDDPDE